MAANLEGPPDPDELERIVRVKEANRQLLLSRPNVIGLDIGYRSKGGRATQELVVKAYVSQKVDRSLLTEEQLLPSTVTTEDQEFGVDVEEGTIPRPSAFTLRSRPLRGGSSISPALPGVGSGTLGICVTLNDRRTYILSNNHVLARLGTVAIGTNVDQPSLVDGGVSPADDVATLFNFVPIDFGTTTITTIFGTVTIPNSNRVDAALAVVTNRNPYNDGNREVHWIGYPRPLVGGAWSWLHRVSLIGSRVCKMGRTSEFTLGTIVSPFFDTYMDYTNFGSGLAFFVDQLKIVGDGGRPFSTKGDSGSLVILYDTGDPIGLLFGDDDGGGWSVANPLDEVLAALAIPQI